MAARPEHSAGKNRTVTEWLYSSFAIVSKQNESKLTDSSNGWDMPKTTATTFARN